MTKAKALQELGKLGWYASPDPSQISRPGSSYAWLQYPNSKMIGYFDPVALLSELQSAAL